MKNFEKMVLFKRRVYLPAAQALYCVRGRARDALYIGSTCDLRQKFTDHHKFEDFVENNASEILWSEYSDCEKLCLDKKKFINEFKPKLNVPVYRQPVPIFEKDKIEQIIETRLTFSRLVRNLMWEYIDAAKTKNEAYEQISKNTGISAGWIARFDLKCDFEPGATKMEKLYLFFTGETLLESLKRI